MSSSGLYPVWISGPQPRLFWQGLDGGPRLAVPDGSGRWSARRLALPGSPRPGAFAAARSAGRAVVEMVWVAESGRLMRALYPEVPREDPLHRGPVAGPLAAVRSDGPPAIHAFWRDPAAGRLSVTRWGFDIIPVHEVVGGGAVPEEFAPCTGFSSGRVDVFWRTAEGTLRDGCLLDGTWREYDLPGRPAAPPAPLAGARPGRLAVFWVSEDDRLMVTGWDAEQGRWRVQSTGAGAMPRVAVAPVAMRHPRMVDVLWVDPADGSVMDTWLDAESEEWRTERVSPGPACSTPAPLRVGDALFAFWRDHGGGVTVSTLHRGRWRDTAIPAG